MLDGNFERPFSEEAEVKCRGYSKPLERRITDFGSDVSFNKVPIKMKEHYGITIPESAARKITERHGGIIKEKEVLETQIPEFDGVKCIVCGIDGSMIPIVETEDSNDCKDKRKTRKVCWKEAKLTICHRKDSIDNFFGAVIGGCEEAGDHLANCAVLSGAGRNTKIHCIGDGAPWISNQVERVFGTQGEYLVDFYHLCEYLSDASKTCAPDDYTSWLEGHKNLAKQNRISEIIEDLEKKHRTRFIS